MDSRPEDTRDLHDRLERALARALGPDAAGAWPDVPGYELEGVLGSGASGTVFWARQLALEGRPVALKLLSEGARWSESGRRRFTREVRALARLRHPGVVRILDVVERPGFLALAMDLVDGISLDRLVASADEGGRPSLERIRRRVGDRAALPDDLDLATFAARVGIGASWALSAVHSAGLIHRDVKPSNLMWSRDGAVLVTDFGLACALEADDRLASSHGGFVGSPAYAAPEQLESDPARLGPATDVFGVGATLHELLAGTPPARRGRNTHPVRKSAPWVPPALAAVVDRCLEPEPALRYASAASLADDLERFIAGLPVRARPGRPFERLRLFVRRHRAAAVALLSGSAVAAASVCVALLDWLWVPGYVETCARQAREQLVYPSFTELVLFHDQGERPGFDTFERLFGDDGSLPGRLPRALELYDRALRLRPERRDLWVEREAVSLALDLWRGRPLGEHEPSLLRSFAASRAGLPVVGDWPPFELPSGADPQELRAVGLLAFLVGDVSSALETSRRVPSGGSPILGAVLGLTSLVREDWDSVLFRLQPAARELSDCGWLWVRCAETALQIGEPAEARQFLERATASGSHDRYHSLERVRGELALLEGDLEEAHRWYDVVFSRHEFPVSARRYALALEWSGRYGEAAATLSTNARLPIGDTYVRNAALEWRTLDPAERVRRLAEALAQRAIRAVWPSGLGDWLELLPDGGRTPVRSPWTEWRPADPFEGHLRDAMRRRGMLRPPVAPDGRVELSGLGACRRILAWPERLRRRLLDEERVRLAATALELDEVCSWLVGDFAGPRLSWAAAETLERAWWPRLEARRPERRPDRPDALLARIEPGGGWEGFGSLLVPAPDGAGLLLEGRTDGRCEVLALAAGRPARSLGLPARPTGGLELAVGEAAPGEPGRYLMLDRAGEQVWLLAGPDFRIQRRDPLRDPNERARVDWVHDGNADGADDYLVRTWDPQTRPSERPAWVELRSGRDGTPLWRWTSDQLRDEAGYSMARAGDRNGDGVEDVVLGGRFRGPVGSLTWVCGRTGRTLHRLDGDVRSSLFGEAVVPLEATSPGPPRLLAASPGWGRLPGSLTLVEPSGELRWRVSGRHIGRDLTPLPDLDGDGHADLAAGLSGRPAEGPGEVTLRSGATGEELFRLRGEHDGDGFGRRVCAGMDWDADGRRDLAILAPRADGESKDQGCLYVYSLNRLMNATPGGAPSGPTPVSPGSSAPAAQSDER